MKKAALILVLGAFAVAASSAQKKTNDFSYSGEIRRDHPFEVWNKKKEAASVGERIRVAFYNIENFTDADNDGPARTLDDAQAQAKNAASLVQEINPDVVMLAEIENEHSLKMLNDALEKPFPFGWVTRLGDGESNAERLNLAILSRIEPKELVELDFGPTTGAGRPPRGLLRATFDLGGDHLLTVYGVHLKSNFGYTPRNMNKRKHALDELVADAKALQKDSTATQELLVIGDFNVDPESKEFEGDWSLSPLRSWADLWNGAPLHERTTIPTRYGDPALEFPPACFDRVYAAGDATNYPWRVGAPGVLQRGVSERISDLPGQNGHASDHYPVWIDLTRDAE
ncbi:MAG: endonuclease/exonuclease/phosphatase family protein [Kiritimatiellae bacterium]|nr:endonuclease/exonuclease/phosphatase family protein [Kiritimatiellia bacterium]